MAAERIVIIGAGPAGLATARSYRDHGGQANVTLLGEEPLLPYERPPLTKELLRGELDAEELAIEQEEWFDAHEVQLRLRANVTAIDPARNSVTVDGKEDLQAAAIVIATGSEPVRAQLPGIDHPQVMTMRRLSDSVRVAERADGREPMLVLGTGFIGCEIAASLAMRGAHVKLIGQEPLPQLQRLGPDAARRIAAWLGELDIELILDASVRAIHDGRSVELDDGSRQEGSCLVLGMGARPRSELARAAGLTISDGAVVVDARMRCACPGASVLAVGDVACAQNLSAGRHLRVEHWGDALEHGRIAGGVLAGDGGGWESVPGFWSTIGEHTLKYAAWGDGYEQARLRAHHGGGFSVWYSRGGVAVGVLTHGCDEDYERGRELIRKGAPAP